MATTTTPRSANGATSASPTARADEPVPVEARLHAIENEVRKQGQSARNAQRSWGIFAVLALLIAGATLLVVATKLDSKASTSATPAAAAPVAAAPVTPPAPGKIGVSLKEFRINPSATQASAGKVTFNVKNGGSVPHEFVVLRTDKPAGSLLKGARADEAGNVGETGDLAPGAGKTLSLNLKAGHYALICNLPGHYRAGQHIDFIVR
jgi:uncharacterized cupredoxin-like copper-binding protein